MRLVDPFEVEISSVRSTELNSFYYNCLVAITQSCLIAIDTDDFDQYGSLIVNAKKYDVERIEDSQRFAEFVPFAILAPSAAAMVWIQLSQVAGVTFHLSSTIAVFLFFSVLLAMAVWGVRRIRSGSIVVSWSWAHLAGIGFALGTLAFVMVRWDGDDTHYLPTVVYMLAHPDTPMGFDAFYIHADGQPFKALAWITSYSSEYFVASFAHVLGLDFYALYWSGKTVVAAFLVPFVWYALLRRFEADHITAILGTALAIATVFVMCDTHNSYGNWFITRYFHGKAIVLTLTLPLIWNHVLAYLERPAAWHWIAIAVAASASIGLATLAAVVVPASVAVLIIAYGLVHGPKIWFDPARFLGLGSAFSYLIAVALYMRVHVHPLFLKNDDVVNGHYPTGYVDQFAFAFNPAFPLTLIIMFVATAITLRALDGKTRRLVGLWCVLYTALFLTPLTASFLIENVTTANVYYRLFLAYPIPLVLGVAAAALVRKLWTSGISRFAIIAIVSTVLTAPHFLLVAQIAFGWERNAPSIVRSIHRVSAGGLRISEVRLNDVRSVLDKAPPGPMLAAQPVNEDVPIYSAHHPQIYARFVETEFVFSSRGDPARGHRRRQARLFASGEFGPNEDSFKARIEAFYSVIEEEPDLVTVVVNPTVLQRSDVASRLGTSGFRDFGPAGRYRVFVRNMDR